MNAIFVTGTGTEVGKTHVCGLLLDFFKKQGLGVGYQKWAATGPGFPPEDLRRCLRVAGIPFEQQNVDLQVPFRFAMPASPHLAAEQEGRSVDPGHIRSVFARACAEHELLVVEGVGGLMVPLTRELLLADLLAELKIPTLIVAASGLGTINHSLLTIEALRARDIPVLGVVFSDGAEQESELLVRDNMKTVGELGKTTVFGRLVRCHDMEAAKKGFAAIGAAIVAALGKD